ncbi:hypothetical protein D3C76_909690 [compost metagenome]
MGNTFAEHALGGELGIQVNRVVVTGHRSEQLDVAFFNGLLVLGLLADFEGFVRRVGDLGHRGFLKR